MSRAEVAPGPAALRRDPVLVGLTVSPVVMIGWYLLDVNSMAVQVLVHWVLQVILDLVFLVFTVRVARLERADRPTRRFWRAGAVFTLLFAAADTVQTLQAVRDPTPHSIVTGTASMIFVVAGMLVFVGAMLTHPIRFTGRARLRMWLDAAAIMTAVAAFAWNFSVAGSTTASGISDVAPALVGSGLMLVGAFAIIKLVLGGNAPFTRDAAIAGTAGSALYGVGTVLAPALLDSPNFNLVLALRLLPCFMIAASPRIQELQLRADPGGPPRRSERPYSRLPYLAVASTQVLLVEALVDGWVTLRAWGVLVGVIVITGLVVVRQLVSFTDNARLLRELDARMLELRHQEERFRSLVQHASDITLVTRLDGVVQYASPALHAVLGVDPATVAGRSAASLLHPEDLAGGCELVARMTAEPGVSVTGQVRARRVDGTWRWLEIIGTNLSDEPSVGGVVYNARDITEARQFQDRLRYEATHDALTKLANRTLFAQRLRAAGPSVGAPAGLSAAPPDRAEPESVTIVVVDLDDFKRVNDTLGHHVGDILLVTVARRLGQCVRPLDTVARFGGDEFAILLRHTTGEQATPVVERILRSFAEPLPVDGHHLTVHASIGLATGAPEHGDALLRAADAAMYVAKQRGKGGYVQAGPADGTVTVPAGSPNGSGPAAPVPSDRHSAAATAAAASRPH